MTQIFREGNAAMCVCALSTVSLYKYTDRQTAAGPINERAYGRARARSPLYQYFCSGLSFLSDAPLLHPTMVYLKCHGGEGVHAHAHAQCSERCWPTGWLRALHRLCCQTAYVYVHVYACARVCMCILQADWRASVRARHSHTYTDT